MPKFILVNKTKLINLDNVNSIDIHGNIEAKNPDEPIQLDVNYTNKQHEYIETTLESVIPAMCVALDIYDDDYEDEDDDNDNPCLYCKHICKDYEEFPCCECINNIDEDTLEPVGDKDMFEPEDSCPFNNCCSDCDLDLDFEDEDFDENTDDDK